MKKNWYIVEVQAADEYGGHHYFHFTVQACSKSEAGDLAEHNVYFVKCMEPWTTIVEDYNWSAMNETQSEFIE